MKPSPVPSILLFIATAALAFSLFGRGWHVQVDDSLSVRSGPIWGEVCFDSGDGMRCETHTFVSDLGKNLGIQRVLGLLFVPLAVGGTIVAAIAAFLLLSRPRSATALVTVILVGGSALIMLGLFLHGISKGGMRNLPDYGFFMFFLGAILAIVGGFLGMSSKRGGGMPMRAGGPMGPPGYGSPPGYGAPPYGAPPGYPPGPGYSPPGYPPNAGHGGAPNPQPAPTAPLGAPDYAQQQAMPQAPAAHASPPHSCGIPMVWDGQHQRWYCQRCSQYG